MTLDLDSALNVANATRSLGSNQGIPLDLWRERHTELSVELKALQLAPYVVAIDGPAFRART